MEEKRQRKMLETFKEFAKDSTLTEEDAIKLGAQLNKRVAKRFKL